MTPSESPQRVQLRRAKGWRMPPNTVKVDRTTRWGNPYRVGMHGTAERCVQLFEYLLGGYLCLTTGDPKEAKEYMDMARRDIHELQGKNLACWCRPGRACHADVLLRVANPSKGTNDA
jgi:Domain of unknown function (DUF4326)